MKYNNFDAKMLLPYGIELNDSSIIQNRGIINSFFVEAFNEIYRKISEASIAMCSPYTLEGCMALSTGSLKDLYANLGIPLYLDNDIETNKKYLNRVCTTPFSTPQMADNIVKYTCNRDTVSSTIQYTDEPHNYNIVVSGDITGINITDITDRILEQAYILLPVSEVFSSFVWEDITDCDDTYVSDSYANVSNFIECEATNSFIVYWNKITTVQFDGDIETQKTQHIYNYRAIITPSLINARKAIDKTIENNNILYDYNLGRFYYIALDGIDADEIAAGMNDDITSGEWLSKTQFNTDITTYQNNPCDTLSALHDLGATVTPSTKIKVYNVENGNLVGLSYKSSDHEPQISNYYWVDDDGEGNSIQEWYTLEGLEDAGFSLSLMLKGIMHTDGKSSNSSLPMGNEPCDKYTKYSFILKRMEPDMGNDLGLRDSKYGFSLRQSTPVIGTITSDL